ncbi:hypothetical protein [Enterococcus larvae]|uniref:hypothetical protein n=1 Tax=Enterococcus larvae TaxID=2794352 RepID=UPI003F395600
MTKIDLIRTKSSADFYEVDLLIDEKPLAEQFYSLTNKEELLLLALAWDKKLTSPQETQYIQKLLKQKKSGNIPLLICPDDLDFDCTVVVVKISYKSDSVVWHKIGYVKKENFSFDKKKTSGYMDYSTWVENDVEKYSEDYFFKKSKDINWEALWSLEWTEEERRRIWHYDHPYFNDDQNIEWLVELNWTFDLPVYDDILTKLIKLVESDPL